MGKIAFVFPGQGAQSPGMGKSLFDNSPAAKAVFSVADALRPATSDQCFSGTPEELAETKNTQPCMFACELAAAAALTEMEISPDMVAGFSLGEVAALTFSGAVSLEDGFRLVCKRGALMQQDAEKVDSAMAAVLKLDNEAVTALCQQFPHVYPVNFNCPGQVTVACLKDELPDFSAAVKAAGGKALPLKVRGGFHCIFMADAAAKFSEALQEVDMKDPRLPLYSNCTARPYEGDYRRLLAEQIQNPVRWEDIIRDMVSQGVDTFFEVGPGNVLSGLIKKIAPDARIFQAGDWDSLQAARKEFFSC